MLKGSFKDVKSLLSRLPLSFVRYVEANIFDSHVASRTHKLTYVLSIGTDRQNESLYPRGNKYQYVVCM